jgi:hypothetical protein
LIINRLGDLLPAMAHVDDNGTAAGIHVPVAGIVFEPDAFGFDGDRQRSLQIPWKYMSR